MSLYQASISQHVECQITPTHTCARRQTWFHAYFILRNFYLQVSVVYIEMKQLHTAEYIKLKTRYDKISKINKYHPAFPHKMKNCSLTVNCLRSC